MRKFLLELGTGFAFVGSQFHLDVGGEDFYVDLLFYHLRLRSYVAIELKTGPFKPEFAGKMNFYLSVLDDKFRHHDDQASIGIILCRTKNKLMAEYALRDVRKPIGISSYRLTHSLPEVLKNNFPTAKELETGLGYVVRKGHAPEAQPIPSRRLKAGLKTLALESPDRGEF